MDRFLKEFKKALMGLASLLPMIVGVMLLVGLFEIFVTKKMLLFVFTSNPIKDTLIGTLSGAVAVGQAIVSYIIGGELLKEGISMYAVSAFILAWVTLGFVQLPAESSVFGFKFTVYRNILSFVFTVIVAIATVFTLNLWSAV